MWTGVLVDVVGMQAEVEYGQHKEKCVHGSTHPLPPEVFCYQDHTITILLSHVGNPKKCIYVLVHQIGLMIDYDYQHM